MPQLQPLFWLSFVLVAISLVSCASESNPSSDAQNSSSSAASTASQSSQASSKAGEKKTSEPAQASSGTAQSVSVAELKTSKPYINRLLPQAQRIQKEQGVPIDVTLAIAILETGWGDHVIGQNNHFGLRCASESCVSRVKRGRTIEYETCPNESECFNLFAESVNKLTGGEAGNIDKLAEDYASDPSWAKRVKKLQKRVNRILEKARQAPSA